MKLIKSKEVLLGLAFFLAVSIIVLHLNTAYASFSTPFDYNDYQTESKIEIINPQSNPIIGRFWTVFFETENKFDLTITPIDETTWEDLNFFKLKCGNKEVPYKKINKSIFVKDYFCNETSKEISKVISKGKHKLKFDFGDKTAFANNSATIQGSGYSVQHGTIFMTSTQQNITISPVVNLSRAFVLVHQWMWQRDVPGTTSTSAAGNANWMMVTAHLSDLDEIFLERASSTDDIFVTWEVIETLDERFLVQRGNQIISGLTAKTTTATIPVAVNITNTFAWQTLYTTLTADKAGNMMFSSNVTGPQEITFKRGGTGAISGHFRWLAVEWDVSKIDELEKGASSLIGSEAYSSPKQETISVTKNQSFLFFQCAATGNDDGLDNAATAGAISSDSQLIFFTYSDSTYDYARECIWSIVDFGSKVGFRDQSDVVYLSSTTYSQSDFFSQPLRTNRTLVYIYTTTNGDGTAYPRGSVFYNITSTELTYQKRYGGQPQYIAWAALELPFNYLPNVTLLFPRNQSVLGSTSVDFTFVTSDLDGNISNCTLWGNFSGSWAANKTVYTPAEDSNTSITINITSGNYKWNVICFDNTGDYSFDDYNFTLQIDVIPPEVTRPVLNTVEINQTHSVRLNVTVIDSNNISWVNATIRYPDNTLKNLSMSFDSNNTYYLVFSDTNQSGIYNFTNIIAADIFGNVNNSVYTNFFFNVTISTPGKFNLSSPSNLTESQQLQPTMTWQRSSDEYFYNYTLLIDLTPLFTEPDFNYTIYGVTNTSKTIDDLLPENQVYYWRVIAFDAFDSFTKSTNDYVYITDTIGPSVLLSQPSFDSYVSTSTPIFNFTPDDANTLDICMLYLNNTGSFLQQKNETSLQKNTPNYINISLGEGNYYWNVLCYDLAQNNDFASSDWIFTLDLTSPVVNLLSPPNNTTENNTNNVIFIANSTDRWSDLASCSLIINEVEKLSKETVQNGILFNFTKFLLNGNYTWKINCTDLNGFTNSSNERNISVLVVDSNPPLATLYNPSLSEFFSIGDINFNYTAEDATGIENCSLYFNGIFNQTDVDVENFQNNYFNLSGLQDGTYFWFVECIDNSTERNGLNSTKRNFTVDLINPTINLIYPKNNNFSSSSLVPFNFTPTDVNLDYCTLYANFSGNFLPIRINNSILNGQENSFAETVLDGIYHWNILCNDSAQRESFASSNFTVNVDTTPPYYFNNISSPMAPTNYSSGRIYEFNVTWKDMFFVDKVFIEHNFSGTMQNQTLQNLSNGHYNFSFESLAAGKYSYKWYANDSLNFKNESLKYIYIVEKATAYLNITFNLTEKNYTAVEQSYVSFNVSMKVPSFGYLEWYLDGDLQSNGSSPLENITYFQNPGFYNITAFYFETENYTSTEKSFYLKINDTTNPNVALIYPDNASVISTTNIIFRYNVSDFSSIVNCSIYLDGLLNETKTSISKYIDQTFKKTFSDGDYTWKIECFDEENNQGLTETRNFTVRESSTLNVSLSTDRRRYINNMSVLITSVSEDRFGSPIKTNTTIDIILGNTSYPWWNSSWKYRRAIKLSQTMNYNRSETIYLNITGLTGYINSCTNDTRVVTYQNHFINLVPFEIIDGDNLEYCHIKFNANITSFAINETMYYFYYDNLDDFDLSSNIETILPNVQRGSIQSSGTTLFADIDVVDTSKSFLLFSYISGDTSPDGGMFTGELFSSQVRFERYIGNTGTVAWQVIEHPDIYVQRGKVTFSSTENNKTVSVNEVALSESFIIAYGRADQSTAGDHHDGWVTAKFINSTNINIERGNTGTAATADWQVIYWRGTTVVNGSLAISGTSVTQTIVPINKSRSALFFTSRVTSAGNGINDQYVRGRILNETGVSFIRQDSGGNMNIEYFVVEFSEGNSVFENTSYVDPTTQNDMNITINVTDMTKAFHVQSRDNSGNGQTFTNSYTLYNMTNETKIRLLKETSSNNQNYVLYLIEMRSENKTTAIIGNQEVLINENFTETDFTGTWSWYWNTTNNSYANYSIVSYATSNSFVPSWGSSEIVIISDELPPYINLSFPVNTYNTSLKYINFTWIPVDEFQNKINCSLQVDDLNYSQIQTENGNLTSFYVENISEKNVSWNVTCEDILGNKNISKTYKFTVIGSPTIINITFSENNSSVILKWLRGAEADSYNVYISENYSLGFLSAPNVTNLRDLNWSDVDFNKTVERYYKISSVKGIAEKKGERVAAKKEVFLNGSWILVSFPFNITNNVLGNNSFAKPIHIYPSNAIKSIYRFNADSQIWESTLYQDWGWKPSIGSETFNKIDSGSGYWFEMNNNSIIFYLGIFMNNTFNVSLRDQWNLIGSVSNEKINLPSTGNEPPSTPFNVTPVNTITFLWYYDSINEVFKQSQHFDIPASEGWWSPDGLNTFDPSTGYYVELSNNATWEVNR